MNELHRSRQLFERGRRLTPGGVHSALRFSSPYPLYVSSASGARIVDADRNVYLDFHLGFGPILLGHGHPRVNAAVRKQLDNGVLYGLSNQLEVEASEMISAHVPSAEMVRFCNSGTEATYHAIRVARAFTGRKKIVKFEGAYHGWHDFVSVSSSPTLREAGPANSPTPVPDSDGLSRAAKDTIIVPFNEPETLERVVRRDRKDIAAIITEPVLHGSATCIPPRKGFLKFLREITNARDIVLLFDEVVSGFRYDLGGAQKLFGVVPDLTTFAKAMANGFPVGAVCGKEEIMKKFKPTGRVEYGGTYNGNPISMAATIATMKELQNGKAHKLLFRRGKELRGGLEKCITDFGLKAQVVGFASVFQLLFTDKHVFNYRDTLDADKKSFMKFQKAMMREGIFLLPHPNKRCHISTAHTKEDIHYTVHTAREILSTMKVE